MPETKPDLSLNLDHPFWQENLDARGEEWMDRFIEFRNRW